MAKVPEYRVQPMWEVQRDYSAVKKFFSEAEAKAYASEMNHAATQAFETGVATGAEEARVKLLQERELEEARKIVEAAKEKENINNFTLPCSELDKEF